MVYATVSGVRSYDVTERTVELCCTLERELEPPRSRDRTVPVTLRFYDPVTFRFELQANPEAGRSSRVTSPIETDAIDTAFDLTVTESEDSELHLDTGELTVVIGLESWSFRVCADDGTTVFDEQRDDRDVRGNHRVDGLGFREEEINHGPYRVSETGTALALEPGERLYGLGEKFTGLDKRGQTIESWHVEPLGTETERAYKNVPLHFSSKGYGLLVDTTNRVSYDLGNTSTASATVAVEGDTFAFVFFYGPSLRELHQQYTQLTGRPDRPPKWSFGVWMSRLGYESRAQLEEITATLREKQIPADVVHLDPFWMRERKSTDLVWDEEQFPDPEGMIEQLHENGFRLSLWEHPHVPVGTDAFEKARDEGYFIEDGTGKPYVMERTCQGDYRGSIVDFTNPEAVEWWKDKHRDLLEMGVDTFKTDYGEYVPEDAVFHNGLTGKAMHNLYPSLYNEAVYETVGEVNGDDDALVWGRAGWTGSQRFPVHWGGDPQTSFNGMAAALRGGLSASLSGIGFWSHDIGGFRGTPSRETYIRWAQFGLLSSHARCHGTTPREPWAFGEEAVDIFRRFARLRYRLMPYLYTSAAVTSQTGLPMVRPLVLAFEDDPVVADIDDQYLLGESLLVAPVFTASGERSIYLPEGVWFDWEHETFVAGEQSIHVDVPLEEQPLFVRGGHVVPTREPSETIEEGTPAVLTLIGILEAGTANGQYYDEDRDVMSTLTARVEDDRIELETGDTAPTCAWRLEGLEQRPTTVIVDGDVVSGRSGADGVGWVYDEGTLEVDAEAVSS